MNVGGSSFQGGCKKRWITKSCSWHKFRFASCAHTNVSYGYHEHPAEKSHFQFSQNFGGFVWILFTIRPVLLVANHWDATLRKWFKKQTVKQLFLNLLSLLQQFVTAVQKFLIKYTKVTPAGKRSWNECRLQCKLRECSNPSTKTALAF